MKWIRNIYIIELITLNIKELNIFNQINNLKYLNL
jgi:hypothetical protein